MSQITHFATENFAGVPFSVVRAERAMGIESIFLSLTPSPHGHDEETSFDLPFLRNRFAHFLRHFSHSTKKIDNNRYLGNEKPPLWQPSSWSKPLFAARDFLWHKEFENYGVGRILENSSCLVLDSGTPFLRNCEFERKFHAKGRKIFSIFYGSDLRKRGIFAEIEKMSQEIFTFEFDHTLIHPRAKFLFYPFETEKLPQKTICSNGTIRIGHSPTKRATKGTDTILAALETLKMKYPRIEIVLIEKMPHKQALDIKSTLDIFIDQIGELGYGISGLEALGMGIPCAVEILDDFAHFLGKNPFIHITAKNIVEKISPFIESTELRTQFGEMGKNWVEKIHNPQNALQLLFESYHREGIL